MRDRDHILKAGKRLYREFKYGEFKSMFVSFFPAPRWFFWSALLWVAITVAAWYMGADSVGEWFGLGEVADEGARAVGVEVFWSPPFLWFYIYYTAAVGIFAAAWMWLSPHPWAHWSILGSALILFVTYFQVQVSVAINDWYGPFYDLIQTALAKSGPVTIEQFYLSLLDFAGIAFVAVAVGVLTRFFVSHYIFRWRTAMNDYYMAHWGRLRLIEGASQRVQEDTMRFSTTVEGLGVSLIDSVMTLVAFLPVLLRLSGSVTELPFVGEVPHALVVVAVLWSAFGTAFLAIVGIKLPGLEFRNQRVEAAYRKELVYGEDDADRAQAADGSGAVQQCAPELFQAVLPLYVLQCRADSLSPDRQHLPLCRPGADHRRWRDHAGRHEPDPERLRAGPVVVPVSGEFMDDDR